MAEYLAAFPLGLLLSFSFGPLFFILLETSISKGVKHAFFTDLGVVFSDLIFFSIAYFGASKLITEDNQAALFVLGGVLLTAYSAVSFINTRQNREKIEKGKAIEEKSLLSFPAKGFFLNIINVGRLLTLYKVGVFGDSSMFIEKKVTSFANISETFFTVGIKSLIVRVTS